MPLNINIQQILLHLFNFTILFAVLYFVLYKPVHNFMQQRTEGYRAREEKLQADLDAAARDRAEMQQRLETFEDEVREKRVAAERELEAMSDREKERARQEAERIVHAAQETAQHEREHILHTAQREIADLAAEAARRVVYADDAAAYNGFLAAVKEDKPNA